MPQNITKQDILFDDFRIRRQTVAGVTTYHISVGYIVTTNEDPFFRDRQRELAGQGATRAANMFADIYAQLKSAEGIP